MRALDLFSGIGGFSLGLERAGMKTVAFCEIDPFCRRVLNKHWPEVPIYEDVRTLTANRLRADGISVDVICGGFPCQDISTAGKGAGIDGERSGLWSEYARIIGEVRPAYVIVENVAALLGRGLDRVLGDLAALGFDAEWYCIPASAVGAPHRRDRVWIVGHPAELHRDGGGIHGRGDLESAQAAEAVHQFRDVRAGVANAASAGLERRNGPEAARRPQSFASGGRSNGVSNARWHSSARLGPSLREACNSARWLSEPDVGRVAHGVPSRVDRLRSLGNAVVPQIPEIIGRAILRQKVAA